MITLAQARERRAFGAVVFRYAMLPADDEAVRVDGSETLAPESWIDTQVEHLDKSNEFKCLSLRPSAYLCVLCVEIAL